MSASHRRHGSWRNTGVDPMAPTPKEQAALQAAQAQWQLAQQQAAFLQQQAMQGVPNGLHWQTSPSFCGSALNAANQTYAGTLVFGGMAIVLGGLAVTQ